MTVTVRDSFEFKKRGQLFVGTDDKSLSVAAMRVCNPNRSPVGINRRDTAPAPTGFAEIVSDDFQYFIARNVRQFIENVSRSIAKHDRGIFSGKRGEPFQRAQRNFT